VIPSYTCLANDGGPGPWNGTRRLQPQYPQSAHVPGRAQCGPATHIVAGESNNSDWILLFAFECKNQYRGYVTRFEPGVSLQTSRCVGRSPLSALISMKSDIIPPTSFPRLASLLSSEAPSTAHALLSPQLTSGRPSTLTSASTLLSFGNSGQLHLIKRHLIQMCKRWNTPCSTHAGTCCQLIHRLAIRFT